ncbi:MAG: ATP synthase F0 subunit B [Desulfobacteraceae bacterium]|nr:ATP synthase F0 subunit B [Desulfobacteraceae bacterium]
MVSIDPFSLSLQIINFLLLIFILNMVLYKPIRKILLDRKEKVNGLEQNIDNYAKEAVEKDQSFASGIKSARAKGLEQKETFLQEALDQEKQIVDRINEKARAELETVKAQIAKDTEAVKDALIKEVDSFAESIGNKILGRAV